MRAIAATLVGWMAMILDWRAATTPPLFWLAAISPACLGASHRRHERWSACWRRTGTARRAEFFGLWGWRSKCSSILGPLTYGAVTWISGGNHRLAILVTGSWFVVGLLILRASMSGGDGGRQ